MGCIACMYTHPWRQALKLDAPRHKGGQQLAGPQEAAGADAVQQQVQLAELDAALIVRKPCRFGMCCIWVRNRDARPVRPQCWYNVLAQRPPIAATPARNGRLYASEGQCCCQGLQAVTCQCAEIGFRVARWCQRHLSHPIDRFSISQLTWEQAPFIHDDSGNNSANLKKHVTVWWHGGNNTHVYM